MSQRKVCVVVNSRANYGRIKSFLRAAMDHLDLELQLIVGASALLYRFGSAIGSFRLASLIQKSPSQPSRL